MMEFFREAPIDAIFLVCVGTALILFVSIGLRWRLASRRAARRAEAKLSGETYAPDDARDGVYWIFAAEGVGYVLMFLGFARWIFFT